MRVRPMTRQFGEPLTAPEATVVRGWAGGLTNPKIARGMFVSIETVKSHAKHARRKLGAKTQAQAVYRAMLKGELSLVGDDEIFSSRAVDLVTRAGSRSARS